jgi:hypothetical protein
MELLNVLCEQYKIRKPKRAVEHTAFLKKIAACQSVSVCVCEIVKLNGFERPQKKNLRFFPCLKIHFLGAC